jgi:hypothetical protein
MRQTEDKPSVFQAILADVESGSALCIIQRGDTAGPQKEF